MDSDPRPLRRTIWLVGIALLLLAALLLVMIRWKPAPPAESPLQPTRTLGPLVPTPLSANLDPLPSPQPQAAAPTSPEYSPQALPHPGTLRHRVGVGISASSPLAFAWPAARPGWFVSWAIHIDGEGVSYGSADEVRLSPPADAGLGMEFVPMLRVVEGELLAPPTVLSELAERYPGRTWLIGNEPDVRWQDNTTPEAYADAYHTAYTALKTADPTAQVAFAGLSQITPLRLAYLDRVWQVYRQRYGREMPVDVWNMHAFVLPERAGDWGVDIPPGFPDVDKGVGWEISDHADLRLVENQIRLMRRWMKEHGQQEKPLWITEYGILMPESYGFAPETVRTFMTGSFDLFQRLRDPDVGDPADEGRLVQRWAWFSTRYDPYPTGNLFDARGQPTALMGAMSDYLTRNGAE